MTVTTSRGATASAAEVRPIAGQADRYGAAAFSGAAIWFLDGEPGTVIGDQPWFSDVIAQVNRLLRVPPNWDGYGAAPLDYGAADRLIALLASWASAYVRSTPHLAISVDGGLLARWENGGFIAQLESTPAGSIEAYFVSATGEEHEMPVDQAQALPKWLWQASLMI